MTRAISPSPSGEPPAIGARLRHARLAQGMTIDAVATAVGLTKGSVSRIERDQTTPSLTNLVALCQVLSIPVGALFEPPKIEIVPLARAPFINMGGTGVVERLLTPRAEPRVQLLRSRLDPGASGGADLYTVNCDLEAIHVLRGAITVRLVHTEVTLRAGDTMTMAGREPHSWHNAAAEHTEVIWIITPAAWSGSS